MKGIVLFADNDPDFLDTRSEFLLREGYEVIKAVSVSEAEWLFRNANFHLAILDVRMKDDDDSGDESGLALARDPTFSAIPKIVLTAFGNTRGSRLALRTQDGFTPAIDYIEKKDGVEIFIQAVNYAFQQHIYINWDLTIDWNQRDPLSVVTLIDKEAESTQLLNRAVELEELFRRLYHQKDHVRIERILWTRDLRVALLAFVFKKGFPTKGFLIVCGQYSRVVEEARRFNELAPRASEGASTTLLLSASTNHFAANAYSLSGFTGTDLEQVRSLFESYRIGPERTFKLALQGLFQSTLKEWHQDKRFFAGSKALVESYSERLSLSGSQFSREGFQLRIETLLAEIPKLGPRFERVGNSFELHIGSEKLSFIHPIKTFDRLRKIKKLAILLNTPGSLTGENILVDIAGRTWLTDFADAGPAPIAWIFVELEAIFRFEWVETTDLRRRVEIEKSLTYGDFRRPDLSDLEPETRKAVRAIQVLRRFAANSVPDLATYQLGIMLEAARRISEFNPALPLTQQQLARLTHALMSMVMVGETIKEITSVQIDEIEQDIGLRFDPEKSALFKNGRRLRLNGQSFKLFFHLYERTGQLCTRKDIVEDVLNEQFDITDRHQTARLNIAIRRLREKIEDDPNEPQHLHMDLGKGYYQTLKPELKGRDELNSHS